jgi:lysozyme
MARDLRSMLQREESCVLTAYPDPVSHGDPWTIGWGHTGPDVHPGLVWTQEQADSQLDTDIAHAMSFCATHFPWSEQLKADAPRYAVLAGMAFQMGARLLPFVNTLAAMRDGRWNDAAGGMLASLWAKQTPGRARRMARQIETGQWQ